MFVLEREDEDKRMVKLVVFFIFKTALFGDISKKNQHIHFIMYGHSSWSTFGSHPSIQCNIDWIMIQSELVVNWKSKARSICGLPPIKSSHLIQVRITIVIGKL